MPDDGQSTENRSAIILLVWKIESALFFSIAVIVRTCVVIMDPQGRWIQITHHHMAELLKSTVDFVWARNKLLLCWDAEIVVAI